MLNLNYYYNDTHIQKYYCDNLAVSNICVLPTNNISIRERSEESCKRENGRNCGVRATNINLVHEDGNKYTGQITLVADGEEETFSINVICDGRTFQYEIPELIGE